MDIGWLAGVIAVAVIDWYAVWTENERLNWFTKPGTILALLVWWAVFGGFQGRSIWFGLALFFGLLGDIFLLLPRRFFLIGLAFFLIGHAMYIGGLWFSPLELGLRYAVLVVPLVALLFLVAPHILGSMREKEYTRRMRVPVLIYMLIISAMVFYAGSTLLRDDWQYPISLLALLGSIFFFCSDTMLAFREFVRPFTRARFWVRITYHMGQILLTLAAVMNFSVLVD